jgi:glycerate 2-kinase
MPSTEPRQHLLQIFHDAVASVNGRHVVANALRANPCTGSCALVAMGKAAVAMAQGAQEVMADQITEALVITKHGHDHGSPWPALTASHPIPDASSLAAGNALLEFVDGLPESRQVLVLISGGASSLIEVLPDNSSLDQLQRLNNWFLSSGVDIATGNEIRKRLSRVKGGRLAQHLWPHPVRCLIISDVPGDDPASIASGPLSSPRPLFVPGNAPAWLAELLEQHVTDESNLHFDHVRIEVIASIGDAMANAADVARRLGYDVTVHEQLMEDDVLETGQRIARTLISSRSGSLHIWGGEPTVRLPENPGRGGRNQSLALAVASAIAGNKDHYFLAGGTDGTDGPGEDAGAVVDADTVNRGASHGFDANQSLARADAGTFLEASGDLIATGPTGTNVMDLAIGMKQ